MNPAKDESRCQNKDVGGDEEMWPNVTKCAVCHTPKNEYKRKTVNTERMVRDQFGIIIHRTSWVCVGRCSFVTTWFRRRRGSARADWTKTPSYEEVGELTMNNRKIIFFCLFIKKK